MVFALGKHRHEEAQRILLKFVARRKLFEKDFREEENLKRLAHHPKKQSFYFESRASILLDDSSRHVMPCVRNSWCRCVLKITWGKITTIVLAFLSFSVFVVVVQKSLRSQHFQISAVAEQPAKERMADDDLGVHAPLIQRALNGHSVDVEQAGQGYKSVAENGILRTACSLR